MQLKIYLSFFIIIYKYSCINTYSIAQCITETPTMKWFLAENYLDAFYYSRVKLAVKDAFKKWSVGSNNKLQFIENDMIYGSNIVIRFGTIDYGKLGTAYLNCDYLQNYKNDLYTEDYKKMLKKELSGSIYPTNFSEPVFFKDIVLNKNTSLFFDNFHYRTNYSLNYVLLHEIGHAIGIGHSSKTNNAIMNQSTDKTKEAELLQYDLYSIYGYFNTLKNIETIQKA